MATDCTGVGDRVWSFKLLIFHGAQWILLLIVKLLLLDLRFIKTELLLVQRVVHTSALWSLRCHYMVIITELAGGIHPLLSVYILAGELLNFALDGIFHKMLLLLLLRIVLVTHVLDLLISILSHHLLVRQIGWRLHPNSGALILVVKVLLDPRGTSAISQVVMHDLSSLSLGLDTASGWPKAAFKLVLHARLFLEADILVEFLLHAGATSSEVVNDTHRGTSVQRVHSRGATGVNSCCSLQRLCPLLIFEKVVFLLVGEEVITKDLMLAIEAHSISTS